MTCNLRYGNCRRSHSCGILKEEGRQDTIIVVGGWNKTGHRLDSMEYVRLDSNESPKQSRSRWQESFGRVKYNQRPPLIVQDPFSGGAIFIEQDKVSRLYCVSECQPIEDEGLTFQMRQMRRIGGEMGFTPLILLKIPDSMPGVSCEITESKRNKALFYERPFYAFEFSRHVS